MTDTHSPSYRWVVLANSVLVFVVAFGFGWTYIVTVVSQVLADLHLSQASWGLLWSAISLGTLATAIVGGILGDRFGVRRIVGLGVVLMGITLALRGTATSFGAMYVWMLLFGMALALTFPNVPKALGMWFSPQEFGMANGVTQAGYGVGGALAVALTPLVVDALGGWRAMTYELGIATVVIGVLWFVMVRDRTPPPPDPGQADPADAPGPMSTLDAIRRVLSLRDMWILAGCHMLFLVQDQGTYFDKWGNCSQP